MDNSFSIPKTKAQQNLGGVNLNSQNQDPNNLSQDQIDLNFLLGEEKFLEQTQFLLFCEKDKQFILPNPLTYEVFYYDQANLQGKCEKKFTLNIKNGFVFYGEITAYQIFK